MLLGWYVISSWFILIWLYPVSAMCPSECSCRQTEKGRRKVTCPKGGMIDPIPTKDMSPDMEVLEITAEPNNWNVLTIGPIFQDFKFLEELYIKRSNILQITMHAFWGVPTLKVLNLSSNNISAVFDHNFRGLVNLVELNLDDNKIARIPNAAFRHLTELKVLNLERNRIGDLVDRIFLKLGKLEVLKLSWNPMTDLNPEVFKDISELRTLQCRGCGLARINTQIYHLLPYLTHLDLGYNRMQFIDAEEFLDLHRLRVLRLDGNQLPVVLERTFVNNVHLKILCLARNRLAKITNTAFLNLSNLYELDISYNKLDRLEGAALQPLADKLQKIVISGNQFGVAIIKIILHVARKINDLSLADMNLSDYPASLLPARLQRLNLSGNHFSNLTVQMLPQQLVALDISRNKFRGLAEHVIIRLEKLEEIQVVNNTWACDLCHISPILFRSNTSNIFKDILCFTPKLLKGKSLSELSYENIKTCENESAEQDSEFAVFVKNKLGLIIAGCGLLLFLILCILFVVVSCLRRHANRNSHEKDKEIYSRKVRMCDASSAIFIASKSEISFKFPLDLTERKVSVSTIDEMKQVETQLHTFQNGSATVI